MSRPSYAHHVAPLVALLFLTLPGLVAAEGSTQDDSAPRDPNTCIAVATYSVSGASDLPVTPYAGTGSQIRLGVTTHMDNPTRYVVVITPALCVPNAQPIVDALTHTQGSQANVPLLP